MTFSPEDLAQHQAALRGEDIYADPPRRTLPPRCPECGRFLTRRGGRLHCTLEVYVHESASMYPWEHQ